MNEVLQIKSKLELALAQITAYENRTTKAESQRIRVTLGDIKKDITGVRAALVAADKA